MIGYQKSKHDYYIHPDKPCYIPTNATALSHIYTHVDLLRLVAGVGHLCDQLFDELDGQFPHVAVQHLLDSGKWVECPSCGRFQLASAAPQSCFHCGTRIEATETEEAGLPTIPYTVKEFAELLADSSDGFIYDVALDAKGNGAGYLTDVKHGNTRYLLFDFYDGPAGMMATFDLNLYKESSIETLIQDLEDWVDGLPINVNDTVYVLKEHLSHEEE